MRVRSLDLGADDLAEREQREARAHGALGVVLARFVGAEGGEDVVAGVLEHLAAVRLDDRGAARQRVVHHAADGFGVESLRERRRADDVHEEDADLPQRLRRHRIDGRRRQQRREPGAQRRHAGVDDGVAEQAALRLEGGDRGFE